MINLSAIKRLIKNNARLRRFLKTVNISLVDFSYPAVLSLLASFFEGISVVLLMPFVKGIVKMDFSFAKEIWFFKIIGRYLPKTVVLTNSHIFIILLAVIFSTSVIKNILQYFAYISTSFQVRKFSNNLRKYIFSRYMSFGNLFFDKNNVGHLNSVLMTFTNIVALQLSEFQQFFGFFFILIVYLGVMFYTSWKITLLIIIIFPVLNYFLKNIIKKIRHTSERYAYSQAEASKRIYNILSCIPLVKAYTKENAEKKDFDRISNEIARLEYSIDKKYSLIPPIQEIILLVAMLLLVSVIAFMVVKQKSAEISMFLVYLYLLKRSAHMFGSLNSLLATLAKVEGPIKEILKMFNDEEKHFVRDGKVDFPGLIDKIEFKDLRFSYGRESEVLKGISISLEKGRSTAIVGPSGAGKTTMVNLILRFYDCPDNTIFINGMDIKEFKLSSLRKHIAFVSQITLLFNDTIRNNILYGLDRHVPESELADVVRKARLYDFILSLPAGFETNIGDRGIKLSGGERQRIAIARALLKKSEILILDEATSSLDTNNEKLIQEAINEAVKDRTSIIIAHRLSTIKNVDKIIVLENGIVAEQGSLNELLEKKGKFYQYWEEQKFF
ncbi:MAG: ABC transporter ATP-binding protein [Candidatus Omnitrophota bacterium]|jgi:subfamily B ATP-binding cassette protein MsbA|nr:MAG: ABC transporter ATP-binding protein [Candidatus Omnitrophota bacterium]